MDYLAEVIQALPGDDFTVYAYFSDGTVKQADVKKLIEKGGVFAPLADWLVFESTLTVINHAVAWDIEGTRDPRTCIDLDRAGCMKHVLRLETRFLTLRKQAKKHA